MNLQAVSFLQGHAVVSIRRICAGHPTAPVTGLVARFCRVRLGFSPQGLEGRVTE